MIFTISHEGGECVFSNWKGVNNSRVAIVHDWLVNYAGADRVVEQMHELFPDAPIYTLVYDPKAFPEQFRQFDIRTTYIQKIPFAAKLYKNLLPLMPGAFERLDMSEYDIVISSCTCCSKGIITRPDALHICYCNTPTRYVWNFYPEYMRNAGFFKRLLIPGMIHKIRMWDYLAAQRVDYFIGNSTEVVRRIQKYYRRDAVVIHPAVHMNTEPLADHPEDYYLMVGRFAYYKRFDLGIQACKRLGKRLIVVGGGDEEKKLRSMQGDGIEFKGVLSDAEIRELYLHAKALIFPGEEDFGIIPVEAQSAGCPVLAYGRGGALDTVLNGKTGRFFDDQSVDAVCACIECFEKEHVSYTRAQIREHAMQFSEERFRQKLFEFVKEKALL